MSSSDDDTFPVNRNEAMDAIEKMIKLEGLEKLTSSKIRAHLSTTFNQNFDDYRKEVDELTRQVIERREKTIEASSDHSVEAMPNPVGPPHPSANDSDSSDEDVVNDRSTYPKKKRNFKRKAENNDGEVDLMTAVKHRRRAAADKAVQILKKTADRTDRSKKRDKNAPKEDHSGKFGRMTKLCLLSEELQSIVGARFMKRCDVIAKIMSKPLAKHIKEPALLGGEIEQEALAEEARLTAEWKARQAMTDDGSAEVSRSTASPQNNDDVYSRSFFARLGRRVRSKSPAVSRLSSETRKTCKSHDVHSGADGCANEVDCADLCHSPHLFGSFIHKLSRRKSKKSGGKLDGHFSKDESHTLPHDIGKTIQQAKLSTPRSAMSENDLRHVTVCRGTDVAVTPITGVSQFVSEDNLAVAECGTPAYRVPSYIRVSCALNGYTKSPRHLESSATRSLGSSLVERRLGMFESMSPDRFDSCQFDFHLTLALDYKCLGFFFSNREMRFLNGWDDISTYVTLAVLVVLSSTFLKGVTLPSGRLRTIVLQLEKLRELLNQIGKESPGDQTMGTFFSTPVRALIGQFDRLQLCSKDKENAAESFEPVRSFVTKEPTPPTLGSHSAEKSAKSERILDDVNKRSSGPPTIIGLIRDVPVMRTDMRTGEDFDRLLESVRSRLQASIAQVLSELEEVLTRFLSKVESMPEEAESSIRIAAGKAQLLVRNKLSKFEELVKKHLSPSKGDPQPATVDDLEGYWALVEIELHDIDECFKKVCHSVT
uniref:DEK_C domain-containing protein n=1 Tax=Angiostrongylus cantonensis TaxID=6313 RepID=A0A158P733_ANGCA